MTKTEFKNLSLVDKLDCLRIFPRAFMLCYVWIFYQTCDWFFLLEDPTLAQAGFVSTIVGAGAGFFGLYVNSGAPAIKTVPTVVAQETPAPPVRQRQEKAP